MPIAVLRLATAVMCLARSREWGFLIPETCKASCRSQEWFAVEVAHVDLPADQAAVEDFLSNLDTLQMHVLEFVAGLPDRIELRAHWIGTRQQVCRMALLHNQRTILDCRTGKTVLFNDVGREDA